ncbi:hypothetical protein GAYE_SCF07G2956 [Galdieria yellowstonensis]|uniref:Pentatricopeptide (PPR) repeat-containing protein n=1 Tax=Galdieria yellowstonensis TaxID=3028027 RepID=A0AAV9ID37_9RHOD|nr:hypothetical protein GAYE_SCF07G2956 [Galdieria yellowstonensis]
MSTFSYPLYVVPFVPTGPRYKVKGSNYLNSSTNFHRQYLLLRGSKQRYLVFPGKSSRKFSQFPLCIPCVEALCCCALAPEYPGKSSPMDKVIERLESFRFRQPIPKKVLPRWRKRRASSLEDTVLPPPGTCAIEWYNKRIRAAAIQKDLKRVLALVREIKFRSVRVKPDAVTYALALSCCSKWRAIEEARKLWNWYLEDNIPADNHVYSSMIAVYARTVPPQYEAAQFLFQQLKTQLQPNKVVYNAMIDICSRTGRMEEALQLFEEIKSIGEKPDEYTYNALIKGYARAGNVQSAVQISNQMHSEGIVPRAITYSVLIDSLGKCKMLDEAFAFFEEMQVKGISPNGITFNVLLSACAACNDYTRALMIVEWMEQRGMDFDRYTFNALIQSAVNSKNYEEALRWYEKMIHSLVVPSNVTFRYLVEAAGGLSRFDLVQLGRWHMEQLNIKGNSYTYAALVASSIRCRQREAAQTFLNEYELSRKKDQRFHHILTEILQRLGGEYEEETKNILV